jgi:hypothetical protein
MKDGCTLMLARVLLFVQVRGLKYAAGWLAGEAFKCLWFESAVSSRSDFNHGLLDMSGFLVTIK